MVEHLNKAKYKADDEYYTYYEDIEKELKYYKSYLKNKNIYCPCDGKESNFIKFFENVKEEYNIKSITATSYNGTDGIFDLLNKKRGLLYKNNKYINMLGNGSFDSDESIKILKQDNIVITNPPFSKIIHFINLLYKYNKLFIIITPLHALHYNLVYENIKQNKIFVGYNTIKNFIYGGIKGGIKAVGCIWLTNLKVNKKEIELSEEQQEIKKYDNYNAYNYNNLKIYKNENRIVGVPITYLKNPHPEFEIIDKKENLFLENKQKFTRIIIKKKS